MGFWERGLFKQAAGRSSLQLLALDAGSWLSLGSWGFGLGRLVAGGLGYSGLCSPHGQEHMWE